MIKSLADRQPKDVHRNDQANFGICGHGRLQAHHSLAGVCDMKAEKKLPGKVTSVKFTNPHGSPALAARTQVGSSTEWAMTLGTATALAQRGIGKTAPNALRTGDEIKAKFLPDGRVIRIAAGNPNE